MEQELLIVGRRGLQDLVRSQCKFMCDGAVGNHLGLLLGLTIEVGTDLGVKVDGLASSLREGPFEVGVALLALSAALGLTSGSSYAGVSRASAFKKGFLK